MTEASTRGLTRARQLVAVALLGPLLVPAGAIALRLLLADLGSGAPGPAWQLLALVGPAIPIYLILLPLLPFGLRALRRGWSPRIPSLLLAIATLGMLVDLVFYLAAVF